MTVIRRVSFIVSALFVTQLLFLSFSASAFVAPKSSGEKSNSGSGLKMGLLDNLLGGLGLGPKQYANVVMGDEAIMAQKAHGTSETPVQENLKWGCDRKVADNICNFNRHYAEYRVSSMWNRF